jgi:hypothetical protein
VEIKHHAIDVRQTPQVTLQRSLHRLKVIGGNQPTREPSEQTTEAHVNIFEDISGLNTFDSQAKEATTTVLFQLIAVRVNELFPAEIIGEQPGGVAAFSLNNSKPSAKPFAGTEEEHACTSFSLRLGLLRPPPRMPRFQ